MLNLLQKDFHIVTTNCESRSNIIDVDNSCKRKTFFMSILIVFLIKRSFFSIVHNT